MSPVPHWPSPHSGLNLPISGQIPFQGQIFTPPQAPSQAAYTYAPQMAYRNWSQEAIAGAQPYPQPFQSQQGYVMTPSGLYQQVFHTAQAPAGWQMEPNVGFLPHFSQPMHGGWMQTAPQAADSSSAVNGRQNAFSPGTRMMMLTLTQVLWMVLLLAAAAMMLLMLIRMLLLMLRCWCWCWCC